MVLLYLLLLAALMLNPSLRPDRMDAEIAKITATLAIWLFFIIAIRITPARKEAAVTADPPERLIEED